MDSSIRIDESKRMGALVADALRDPQHPATQVVERVRSPVISMLAPQTLTAMHVFAREAPGVILEIGAYVGGGTIVLLDGARQGGKRVITIEEPVAHPTHPHIPTENTILDLRANLHRFADASRHILLEGASFEQWLLGTLVIKLMGESIGFLAWDADSMFDRDLALLAPLLAPNCLVMVDDYDADNAKSGRIGRCVNEMVAAGLLETIAILPWATWFGRLLRKPTPAELLRWRDDWERERAAGDVYADRILSYWEHVSSAAAAPALDFGDRAAFWERATRQARGA